MTLDQAVFGVVALFGLLGLIGGLVRQLSHWLALLLAWLLSKPLAAALAPELASKLGWPVGFVQVGLASVLFSLLLVVGGILFQLILAQAMAGRAGPALNRGGGLVLGAGKAAAACWVLLSAALFFEKPLGDFSPAFKRAMKGSEAAALARRRNLFAKVRMPALDSAARLMSAAKDPKAVRKLLEDPQLKALLENPALKAALTDSSLAKAAAGGDAEKMLGSMDLSLLTSDPKMAALLEDPKLKEILSALPAAPAVPAASEEKP